MAGMGSMLFIDLYNYMFTDGPQFCDSCLLAGMGSVLYIYI